MTFVRTAARDRTAVRVRGIIEFARRLLAGRRLSASRFGACLYGKGRLPTPILSHGHLHCLFSFILFWRLSIFNWVAPQSHQTCLFVLALIFALTSRRCCINSRRLRLQRNGLRRRLMWSRKTSLGRKLDVRVLRSVSSWAIWNKRSWVWNFWPSPSTHWMRYSFFLHSEKNN